MITIEVDDEVAARALARMASAASDATEPMTGFAEYWLQATKDRVLRGLTPDGLAFAPRSQTTLAAYAARGLAPVGGPLRLTDTMRGQIWQQSGPDFAEIGSNAIQAAVMQFGAAKGAFGTTTRGASIPWGNIPARPFLGFGDEDRTALIEEIEEWLQRLAAAPAP